jgi:hypothetical protein
LLHARGRWQTYRWYWPRDDVMAKKRPLKVGVKSGASSPPFVWNVGILDVAFEEAMQFLNPAQYTHLRMQVQELAREEEPTRLETVDVRPVEKFFELRDKGGVMGNINVRLFFGLDKDGARCILILGVINKSNEGKTPQGDKVLMRRRWRDYLNGDYGQLPL